MAVEEEENMKRTMKVILNAMAMMIIMVTKMIRQMIVMKTMMMGTKKMTIIMMKKMAMWRMTKGDDSGDHPRWLTRATKVKTT